MVLLSPNSYAKIYKTVDEDGTVVFTDVPPKDHGEAVELSQGNRYQTTAAPISAAAASEPYVRPRDEEDVVEETRQYDDISITSPIHNAAVRDNAGNVNITYSLAPQLDTEHGHQVELVLDGAVTEGFNLTNLDRGTHTAIVRVTDAAGGIVSQSAPVSFHLLRHSALRRRAN